MAFQGLTDREQALATFMSALLIAIGAMPTVGLGPNLRFIIMLLGVIGLAVKEFLGSAPPAPITTGPKPIPAPTVVPVVLGVDQFDPVQAKAIGEHVFLNPNQPQGYVTRFLGVWYDIYGHVLSTDINTPPTGTGTEV